MKLQVLEDAQEDLRDGYRFYERQLDGLGNYSLDCLFSDIDSLRIHSGVHGMFFGLHRLLSRRFPFTVYYRIAADVVRVYAVLDCRRDPSWIRGRLK